MSDIAIRVENLGKQYRIGKRERYRTLRDSITDTLTAPFRGLRGRANGNGEPDQIWALKDVSFEIPKGEVVGVIGRNGAGKSTLLKVLSRITEPTEGHAAIQGRVGSLLEVGTGFHPELTGRENIYLNGAILGMKKAEIARRFDEIVAFAEVEKFLDTPVKHYSSGMYVRLAFAVAAHLESEILVVDEVLAVGDAAFQKKCLGKMGDVVTRGRTVLFVSHNMASISSLCKSAILLSKGTLSSLGTAGKIIDRYLSSIRDTPKSADIRSLPGRRGSGEVRIVNAAILDAFGNESSTFKYDDDICVEFALEEISPSPELISAVWIHTAMGTPVLHLASHDDNNGNAFRVEGTATVRCLIRNCRLYPGTYFVSLWIAPTHYQDTDFVPEALQFRMEQGELLNRGFEMSWRQGIFHCNSEWEICKLATASQSPEYAATTFRN